MNAKSSSTVPTSNRLHVLVLAGGPDREREVSLSSGASVARALRDAGHQVTECDLTPDDLTAMDDFVTYDMDIVFSVLHGPWGEGGPMQRLLEAQKIPFVGSGAQAAALAMDKQAAKATFRQMGLPTPPAIVVMRGEATPTDAAFAPPVVVKPVDEGSSIHLSICHDAAAVDAARISAHRDHDRLLVERFIDGRELTVGVLGTGDEASALPVIEIVPAVDFYDYEAKYTREDTTYRFDSDLPPALLIEIQAAAVAAHRKLGCCDLSRTDVLVDRQLNFWLLEINTLPGFTDHSLVPKAAAHAGTPMPALCDRLVQSALKRFQSA